MTEDRGQADRLLREILAPALGRDAKDLEERLPIGSPEHCLALLRAYTAAGAQEILLWPIQDPIRQLHVFSEKVRSNLEA